MPTEKLQFLVTLHGLSTEKGKVTTKWSDIPDYLKELSKDHEIELEPLDSFIKSDSYAEHYRMLKALSEESGGRIRFKFEPHRIS